MAELAGVMVGNYFLLECLGREGMVETYRARPTTRGGYDVVLRLFRPQFPDPTGFQEHFAAEVEKVWRCHHEHIQPLLEFGAGEGLLYTATKLSEAETLEQFLERSEGQAAPVPLVVQLIGQVCAALQYAHEREIVHGNVQPASMLLQDSAQVLLTNFSMKRIYREGGPVVAQVEEGNPAYTAPEQVVGMVSPAADVYAVGVLLYRLLTGRLPYDGESAGEIALKHANEPIPSLRDLRPDLPEALELVVRVALAKSPQARFPGAAALAEALLAAVISDSPPVIAVSPQRRIFVRARRTRLTWTRVLSLLAIVLVLSGLVGTLIFFSTLPLHLGDIPVLPFPNFSQSGARGIGPGATGPTAATTSPASSTEGDTQPTLGPGSQGQPTPTASLSQTPTINGTASPGPTSTPVPTPPPVICTSGTLALDGSANLQPLLQQVNADYTALCPDLAISLRADGNRIALGLVQQHRIDVAASDLTAGSSFDLTDHEVAAFIYSLIVSPDVQLGGLSSAQIQAIYGGKITNWAQVGGPDEAITVILPAVGDAANPIFRAFILNGVALHVKAVRLKQDVPGLVVQSVASMPGAISYVPLGALQGANVRALAIDGVPPGIQAVQQDSYTFWGVQHLYTAGEGTTQFQDYLQFLASAQEGDVLLQFGVVPASLLGPDVLASHLPGPEIS